MGEANPPTRVVNPYARMAPTTAQNNREMGRQSQQRISNQHKRKFKLASNSSRKKGQLTLLGGVAFEANKDCCVCKARHLATFIEGYRVPKRPHHPLCLLNTKTRGKGELSEMQKVTLEDNKRYKELVRPITAAEKGSSRHLPDDHGTAFFAPRISQVTPAKAAGLENKMEDDGIGPSFSAKQSRICYQTAFSPKSTTIKWHP